MSINRAFCAAILNEHQYRPIRGKVLCIANLSVFMTPNEVATLAGQYGISVSAHQFAIDEMTVSRGVGQVDMRSFFRVVCQTEVDVMDISDYEGAELIADLNDPIDQSLYNRYDVVIDGGTLDNIFDTATALRNFHNFLVPGGRLLCCNTSNSALFNSAYSGLPPDWYFDFFVLNRYADIVLYFSDRKPSVVEIGNGREYISEIRLVEYSVPKEEVKKLISEGGTIEMRMTRVDSEWKFDFGQYVSGSFYRFDFPFYEAPFGDVILIAEKGEHIYPPRNPVQIHYRSLSDHAEMFWNARHCAFSQRPRLVGEKLMPDVKPYFRSIGFI